MKHDFETKDASKNVFLKEDIMSNPNMNPGNPNDPGQPPQPGYGAYAPSQQAQQSQQQNPQSGGQDDEQTPRYSDNPYGNPYGYPYGPGQPNPNDPTASGSP